MTPTDPESLLGVLVAHEVDFVVIGGVAVISHGFVRSTRDLDIVFDRDTANLNRLAGALQAVAARLRGAEDVPIPLDARFLNNLAIMTFTTSFGAFDCLAEPAGVTRYADVKSRATRMTIGAHEVLVASIDDLVTMKKAAGRPSDREDIEALEVIRDIQSGRR